MAGGGGARACGHQPADDGSSRAIARGAATAHGKLLARGDMTAILQDDLLASVRCAPPPQGGRFPTPLDHSCDASEGEL